MITVSMVIVYKLYDKLGYHTVVSDSILSSVLRIRPVNETVFEHWWTGQATTGTGRVHSIRIVILQCNTGIKQ